MPRLGSGKELVDPRQDLSDIFEKPELNLSRNRLSRNRADDGDNLDDANEYRRVIEPGAPPGAPASPPPP